MAQTRWRVGVCGLAVASLALNACGGKATGSDGAASGGESGLAGSTSMPPPPPPIAFDDAFPWFTGSGTSMFAPGGQGDVIPVLEATGTPARGTLSTHNVFDGLSGATWLEFRAKASAPIPLLACARHSLAAFDYFAARDAGDHWPVYTVAVGVEWAAYRVRLTDMQPPEPAADGGLSSFFIAFIAEGAEPVTVWLDEVRLR